MFGFIHSVLSTAGCLGFIFLMLYLGVGAIYRLKEYKNRKK